MIVSGHDADNYLGDECEVIVRAVDQPGESPDNAVYYALAEPITLTELIEMMIGPDGYAAPHGVEKRHHHWSWGSSSDGVTYFVTIAAAYAPYLTARLVERLRADPVTSLPLDRDNALDIAAAAVRRVFDISWDSELDVLGEEVEEEADPATRTFRLAGDGWRYEVTVTRDRDGRPRGVQVKRDREA